MTNSTTWPDPNTAAAETVPGHNPVGMYLLSPSTNLAVEPMTNTGSADVTTSGTLTSASGAGSTVQLQLGSGQATWEAQFTGTFSNGTTIVFEGSDDASAPTNWDAAVVSDTSQTTPSYVTSVNGTGTVPVVMSGRAAGYQFVRVRCSALHSGDSVSVRLIGSTGGGSGNLVTNDGTFAKESGGNLATLAGAVSGGKVATKAASGDFAAGSLVDLATLLTLAGTPTDANTVNSLMGRLTKLRDLLNAVAYDNTSEIKTSVYGKNSTAGDTALGLDGSGRITSLLQAVGGTALQADQSNTILKTSLYGKNAAAGDTALLLDALGQMTIEQFITYQIMAGHGFRVTTGLVATGAGSNNYVGIQAIVNAIGKNVLFYGINGVAGSGAASQDTRLYTNNANSADGTLSTNLLTSIKNQQPGGATTSSLSALWGSPASTTQTGGFVGTLVEQDAIVANAVFNPLADGSFVWFKAGDVGSLAYYVRVTATTNQAACNLKWIEW